MRLRLSIPAALATELRAASKVTGVPVYKYAEQIIEQWAAEKRMTRLVADREKNKGFRPVPPPPSN